MPLPRIEQFREIAGRHPLVGIMAISLAIKLLVFGFDHVINPDGVGYIAAAQQITAGNIMGALKIYPMIGYPSLLAAVYFIIPDWIAAARLINIVALVGASIPLYGITRILFNRQAAFWATLCFALTPEGNEQVQNVIRDPVFLFAALSSILYFLKGSRQQSLKPILGALLLAGISFFFRVEGVVFLLVPILILSLRAILAKKPVEKQFSRKALAVWTGVPLSMFLFLGAIFGSQLLTQNRLFQFRDEIHRIMTFSAFDKYQEISRFLETIENQPPFSVFSKSLPTVVRHWMPLIYLIGLMEYFIKQLFVLFLIPLLVAVRHYFVQRDRNISREKSFVLITWIAYMLLVLYSYMVRDFVQARFLFTPAVLLFPWVGHGITLVNQQLKEVRFSRVIRVALALIIIVSPCVKSVSAVMRNDSDQMEMVGFIQTDRKLADAKILFSDSRYYLYIQKSEAFSEMRRASRIVFKHLEKGQVTAIENQASQIQADAIVLSLNSDAINFIPEFEHYRIYKKFPYRKGITVIYTLKTAEKGADPSP